MVFRFTKKTYPDGLVQLVVEAETAPGVYIVLGARGIPAVLADDSEYLENLKPVALKEFLAHVSEQAPPGEASLGVIVD
jgi:hypothetical protein